MTGKGIGPKPSAQNEGADFLIKREFPRLCRGGSRTLRIPGVYLPLLPLLCRNRLFSNNASVAVALAFNRLRLGPFEGPATESLRLCRRILTAGHFETHPRRAIKGSKSGQRSFQVISLEGECSGSCKSSSETSAAKNSAPPRPPPGLWARSALLPKIRAGLHKFWPALAAASVRYPVEFGE
jgi:hypothetical protein